MFDDLSSEAFKLTSALSEGQIFVSDGDPLMPCCLTDTSQ